MGKEQGQNMVELDETWWSKSEKERKIKRKIKSGKERKLNRTEETEQCG